MFEVIWAYIEMTYYSQWHKWMTGYLQGQWYLMAQCWLHRRVRFVRRHSARGVSACGTRGKHPLLVGQMCLVMITHNFPLFTCDVPTPVDIITVLCPSIFCGHHTKCNFLNATSPYIKAPHLTTHAYWRKKCGMSIPNNIVHHSKSNVS